MVRKKKCSSKMDKKLFWSIRITLGVLGVIALYQVVPYLVGALNLLIELFKLTDTTPEFKIILVCISLYLNCCVINVIVNIVSKLHGLIEDKITKE